MAKITFDWLKESLGAIPLPQFSNRNPPNYPQPFDGNYTPVAEHLSAFIKREMKSKNLTGLSIALVDNQKMVWSEGFGLANKASNIRASNKSRYRVASISKMFNAVAVMREVEQGNLDLDTAVVKYVPEFRINSRFGPTDDITLRNLLTHHSGLPGDLDGKWGRVRPSLESILPSLATAHTAYPANKFSTYSNIGVSLSGLAVQMQSGKDYEDYMLDYLLKPLRMVDSDFSGQLAGAGAAVGYSNGEVVENLAGRDLPAGGLISTVDDMANFAIAILGKGRFEDEEIVTPDSIAEMLRVQNTNIPLDLAVRPGLGCSYNIYKLGGRFEVVGHSGGSLGHSSLLSLVPELGIGVVVLSNNPHQSNSKERIIAAALQQLLLTRGIQDSHQDSGTAHREIDANEILPGHYAGNHGLIRMSRTKTGLRASSLNNKLAYILNKNSGNWYTPRNTFRGIPLPITEDARVTGSTIDGRDLLISLEDGQLEIFGERIELQSESDIWTGRSGYYKIRTPVEPTGYGIIGVSLEPGDGYYLINFYHGKAGKNLRAVQPLNDTELVELGMGRGLGNTIAYSESSGKPTLSSCGRIFELETSSSNHPSVVS